jgi:hypothetical protein
VPPLCPPCTHGGPAEPAATAELSVAAGRGGCNGGAQNRPGGAGSVSSRCWLPGRPSSFTYVCARSGAIDVRAERERSRSRQWHSGADGRNGRCLAAIRQVPPTPPYALTSSVLPAAAMDQLGIKEGPVPRHGQTWTKKGQTSR